MKIELTARQRQRQEKFRAFATEHVAPMAADFDRNEAISENVVRGLAKTGLLGSFLPSKHGGGNLDLVSYGLLHQEIGAACSSTRSLLTVHDMVAEVIYRLGSTELGEEWLPDLASGTKIGAFALTEPEAGSDAGNIRTTASEHGNEYVLNGRKKWISFAQLADVFLVMARVGERGPIGGFLVPVDTPPCALCNQTV